MIWRTITYLDVCNLEDRSTFVNLDVCWWWWAGWPWFEGPAASPPSLIVHSTPNYLEYIIISNIKDLRFNLRFSSPSDASLSYSLPHILQQSKKELLQLSPKSINSNWKRSPLNPQIFSAEKLPNICCQIWSGTVMVAGKAWRGPVSFNGKDISFKSSKIAQYLS